MGLKQEVLEITIGAAQLTKQEKIELPSGKCTRIGLVNIGTAPDKNINVGLKNSQGDDVVEPHTYKLWEQRQGGDYFDSLKPVDFKCGRTITFQLSATEARAADTVFQVVFFIDQQ